MPKRLTILKRLAIVLTLTFSPPSKSQKITPDENKPVCINALRWQAIKRDAEICNTCHKELSDSYKELADCEIRAIKIEHGEWWHNEYVVGGLVILALGFGYVAGKEMK